MSQFLRSSRQLAPVRLSLEQLEDRRVLSVSYHGGALLTHVEVEPLYYGQGWNSTAQAQQAQNLNTFLGTITNSAYMDMLGEYGVGRGRLLDNGVIDGGVASGQTVDDTQIQRILTYHIGRGDLQSPDANRLYVVYTAPNVVVTQAGGISTKDFFGYHNAFIDGAGRTIYYAVIVHPVGNGDFASLNDFQTLTKVTTHELAESVTDPAALTNLDPGGWFGPFAGYKGDQEIGDVAEGPNDVGTFAGYVVQKEWSQQRGANALPGTTGATDVPPAGILGPLPASIGLDANLLVRSYEYFAGLIQKDYQQFLGRSAAPDEVNRWVAAMLNGVSDEQVLAGFVGSPEYYQHVGGTGPAWVDALYHDVLGRAPDTAGEAGWLQYLAGGADRSQIAWGFATSWERESLVVQGDYQHYLGRRASDAEVAGWVNAFENGYTNEQVVAGFIGSPEYYYGVKKGHGSGASWVSSAYLDLFHRAAAPAEVAAWVGALD